MFIVFMPNEHSSHDSVIETAWNRLREEKNDAPEEIDMRIVLDGFPGVNFFPDMPIDTMNPGHLECGVGK